MTLNNKDNYILLVDETKDNNNNDYLKVEKTNQQYTLATCSCGINRTNEQKISYRPNRLTKFQQPLTEIRQSQVQKIFLGLTIIPCLIILGYFYNKSNKFKQEKGLTKTTKTI